jgi:hypothetical protein
MSIKINTWLEKLPRTIAVEAVHIPTNTSILIVANEEQQKIETIAVEALEYAISTFKRYKI